MRLPTLVIRLVAGIVSVLLVGGAAVSTLGPMLQRTEASTFEYPAGTSVLRVDNGVGRVQIRAAADGEEPSISATRSWGIKPPTQRVETSGDEAHISASCPPGLPFDVCSTDWAVVVPPGTRVVARNGVGGVDARDVDGDVEVSVGVGQVTLDSVGAETIDVEVGVGDVTVDTREAPRRLAARTGVGSATITVPGRQAYDVRTEGSGARDFDIRVEVSRESQQRIDLAVGVGGASVRPR